MAVVEFGPKLRAWAVREGGNSGDPASPHFTDQVERFASGNLRPVYFYPEDLKGHVERTYKPGHKSGPGLKISRQRRTLGEAGPRDDSQRARTQRY